MIGGRRMAGVCCGNQKGGCHDSNRTQQSATSVMAMKEGCTVGRGGMRRRFIFIFKIEYNLLSCVAPPFEFLCTEYLIPR